jgi:hypothetical protein
MALFVGGEAMAEAEIHASYDELADVAYISVGRPDRKSRNREAERGVVWRVSPDGEYRGVTILQFSRHWRGRGEELVALLRSHLPVNSSAKKQILEMA